MQEWLGGMWEVWKTLDVSQYNDTQNVRQYLVLYGISGIYVVHLLGVVFLYDYLSSSLVSSFAAFCASAFSVLLFIL